MLGYYNCAELADVPLHTEAVGKAIDAVVVTSISEFENPLHIVPREYVELSRQINVGRNLDENLDYNHTDRIPPHTISSDN